MKKRLDKTICDDLRPEYDLSKLKGGVRGKYYRQALDGKNQIHSEIAPCDLRRKRSEVRDLKKKS